MMHRRIVKTMGQSHPAPLGMNGRMNVTVGAYHFSRQEE